MSKRKKKKSEKPGIGTISEAIWRMLDVLTDSTNNIPSRSDAIIESRKYDFNPSTTSAVYGKWKKYKMMKSPIAPDPPAYRVPSPPLRSHNFVPDPPKAKETAS